MDASSGAVILDRIKKAYDRNPDLPNLLVDPEFAEEITDRQFAWRLTPGMSSSLAYFDTYRRERLPANLVQAQGITLVLTLMRELICWVHSILNGLSRPSCRRCDSLALLGGEVGGEGESNKSRFDHYGNP